VRRESVGPAILITALGFSLIAAAQWRTALPPIPTSATTVISLHTEHLQVTSDSIADAENLIVDNDPFRLSNTAPTVRYSALAETGASGTGYVAPQAPRPTLILKAIVGGPPWRALIDGIPGQPPGTLAEPGSKFDKLVVRSVSSESVVIQGMDTSWVLTFSKR